MASADELLAGVLKLDEADRARFAQELLASLHQQQEPDAAKAWAAEINKRAREALSGRVEMVDGEKVLKEARARLHALL